MLSEEEFEKEGAWTTQLMHDAGRKFSNLLREIPNCTTLDDPCLPKDLPMIHWENVLLSASSFRRGHVEIFDVAGRLSVLHVCVLPNLDDDAPIFGFDMIAGPSRVTGIFLDLSPVTTQSRPTLADVVGASALGGFRERRTLPDWGDIFSPHVLAIRPTDRNEVTRALELAQQALEGMLARLAIGSYADDADVIRGQAAYMAAQRRNKHTQRMLSGFIGDGAARKFIEDVLFPTMTLDQSST